MSEKIELADCLCGNSYLAIRTDIYKDKRQFVYCDCCGALTTRDLWGCWVKPVREHIGRMIIGYRECGRVVATAWIPDPAECKKQFREFIAAMVENPIIVRLERVERYRDDPEPDMECARCKGRTCSQ